MELHETNQDQDSLFPVGLYHVTPYQCIPHGRGYHDLHWHEELQYVLVIEGQVTFQVNGIDYLLHKNDILFINKGILHMSTSMSQDAYYVSLNFPEKMLNFFLNSRMYYKYVSPYTDNTDLPVYKIANELIVDQFKQIISLFKQQDFEYEVSLLIVTIWKEMISYFKDIEIHKDIKVIRQQERLQNMLNFIHQNYYKSISLQDIAESGNMSIAQCYRYFKMIVKMSPYDYLIHYRLLKSIDYLLDSTFNITEISEKVGFQNVNHYIQTFKKAYTLSPKKYQKEHRKK